MAGIGAWVAPDRWAWSSRPREITETPMTLLIEADAPIVVERGLIFRGQAGTARQLGVPLT